MMIATFTRRAISLSVALALAVPVAGAQATSEQRIPVRKTQPLQLRESRGEVAPPDARIRELEVTAADLKARLEASEAAAAARATATDKTIAMLRDSLRIVNYELVALRQELARANALNAELADKVFDLEQRFDKFPRFGKLFGNSGFYVGLGTGANFTTGTLTDIGYHDGLNVSVPIGWMKPTYPLGFRTEFGVQTFEGKVNPTFINEDPVLYSATAMLTLNLPINDAKTNLFYLMGGGGAYFFHRFGTASALADRFDDTKNVTKFGVTGGAGFELHILGATSLFVQSAVTNVFGDESTIGNAGSKNLRWIPVVAGITLR